MSRTFPHHDLGSFTLRHTQRSHGQRSPKMEELIIRLLIGMLICMKKLPLIRLMTIYYGETIAVDWPWHTWACLKILDPKKSDPPKYNHFFQVAVLVFLSFILTWGRFSIAHEVVICCFQIDDWNHQFDFDEYSHCCFHWFPRSLTFSEKPVAIFKLEGLSSLELWF